MALELSTLVPVTAAGLISVALLLFGSRNARRAMSRMYLRLVGHSEMSAINEGLAYVMENAESGDPDVALAALDKFSAETGESYNYYMMNVGPEKGEILDKAFIEAKPKFVLELGTYCGYSTVRMARFLRPGQGRLISLELNREFAEKAKAFIKFAGVDDRVEVVIGDASDLIPQLKDRFGVPHFDFVFLDHKGDVYLRDLKLLEKNNLLKPGSVIVGDNVFFPGAPEFRAYMLESPNYKSVVHDTHLEYTMEKDEVVVGEFLG